MQYTNLHQSKCLALPTLWIIAILMLAACQVDNQQTQAPIQISVQLSWVHEYSFNPFHNAQHNNHFAAQNLEVTLLEGGFRDAGFINAIDQVVAGNADFGAIDG